MTNKVKTRDESFGLVRSTLAKIQASEEVRRKVIAVFTTSSAAWWLAGDDYIDYLVRQLVTLFSHKFEDDRMTIPGNMVYLLSVDGKTPSILLHWRVYLSLYRTYVRGWRLETIKSENGQPVGMIAIIIDNDGNEWRWERYYESLHIVQRWKNRELMFAKTILKEALAIMFPQLNLLPPLSTVETYDPDDVDGQNVDGQNNDVHPAKSSSDFVRAMSNAYQQQWKRDKMQDVDLSREIKAKFKELADTIGYDRALNEINSVIRSLGAERFNDLDSSKKRFVIMNVDNIIFSERQMRKEKEENAGGE